MEKINLFADEINLTPEEYILALYQNTDENGILEAPRDYILDDDWEEYENPPTLYRCKMKWNEKDRDNVIRDCLTLIEDIKAIARLRRNGAADDLPEYLRQVEKKYLRKFSDRDACDKEAFDAALQKYDDGNISAEELALLDKYRIEHRTRFERSMCSGLVVYRARRLCRLLEMGAPPIIITHECRWLAQMLVFNRFCQD